MTVGVCRVLVAGVPPAKVHVHCVGVCEDKSVKTTLLPVLTVVESTEKSTVGGLVIGVEKLPNNAISDADKALSHTARPAQRNGALSHHWRQKKVR